MLSGGESLWRPLKEALPATDLPEGMKAESGILHLYVSLQAVDAEHLLTFTSTHTT